MSRLFEALLCVKGRQNCHNAHLQPLNKLSSNRSVIITMREEIIFEKNNLPFIKFFLLRGFREDPAAKHCLSYKTIDTQNGIKQ